MMQQQLRACAFIQRYHTYAYVAFWVIAAVVLVGLVVWGIMDPVNMRGVHVIR